MDKKHENVIGLIIGILVAAVVLIPILVGSQNRGHPVKYLKKNVSYTQRDATNYLFLQEQGKKARFYLIKGLKRDNLPKEFVNIGKTKQGYVIVPYEPTVPK